MESQYSDDDSFESVHDEHSLYLNCSGRRESICLAESSDSSGSESQYGKELSAILSNDCDETVDSYSAEFESEETTDDEPEGYRVDFVKKKLEILNRFGLRDGAHVKEQKSVNSCGEQQTDDQSPCLETVTFCKKKIEHIRGCLPLGSSNADPVQSRPKINHCHNGEADPMWVGNVAKIENLKIENLLHNMSKAAVDTAQHYPRSCTNCRKQRSKLAEVEFAKSKLEVLKRPAFEARLDNHLYGRDGATLLAKIINSGPKPSDPPEEIWGRLLKKGHTDR